MNKKIQVYIKDNKMGEMIEKRLLNSNLDKNLYTTNYSQDINKLERLKIKLKKLHSALYWKIKKLFPKKSGYGGGVGTILDGSTFSTLYENAVFLFVAQGIAWDTLKIISKQTYNLLESKKINYVVIMDDLTFGPHLKHLVIRIPNNLTSCDLDTALDDAELLHKCTPQLLTVLKKKKIIFTYKNNNWKMKLKS